MAKLTLEEKERLEKDGKKRGLYFLVALVLVETILIIISFNTANKFTTDLMWSLIHIMVVAAAVIIGVVGGLIMLNNFMPTYQCDKCGEYYRAFTYHTVDECLHNIKYKLDRM